MTKHPKRPQRTDTTADTGAEGLAYLARPKGDIKYERLVYNGYTDVHLIDRMRLCNQLNELQHKAAQRVLEEHDAAGFEPSVTANYSPLSNRGHDDDTEENAAITRFRKLLGSCSQAAALQLHSMCLEIHPGVARLASLRSALDGLAKHWGMA